ncbi:helix-turn-helix transcriptional regulator [Flammeovirga pacifica]|uniref:Uncharacterized protein n=1 Tax=Flammeovirga pacifica TaxID=915059 RepID=A0A1S1YUA2_FLAPC|nr:WYL domain-containing protein [Flammeovirga pacifica]OHX64375.1 hypothetical protein NH26_22545 [Flammeovirga pacifica]
MPINKNAQIRYNTLDRCFRNTGRMYFIDDLIIECNKSLSELDPNTSGIRKRQVFDDIKFMESEAGYGIELDRNKEGRRTYYRYSNTKFSISNQPINEKEASQLKSALTVLGRFEGMPQFEWVRELKTKLSSTFSMEDQDQVISFDNNSDYTGIIFLEKLFDAVTNKRVIEIEYTPFGSTETKCFVLHPYYLKQYNNRWFLLGKDERFSSLTTLPLDRMRHVKEVDQTYIPNVDVNFLDYFYDIVGVTRTNEESQLIEFCVINERADYVRTKPIHGTQKEKYTNEKGTVFSIDVIPNKELETQLFSFGDALTVLSPKSFRNQMNERVKKLYEAYQL